MTTRQNAKNKPQTGSTESQPSSSQRTKSVYNQDDEKQYAKCFDNLLRKISAAVAETCLTKPDLDHMKTIHGPDLMRYARQAMIERGTGWVESGSAVVQSKTVLFGKRGRITGYRLRFINTKDPTKPPKFKTVTMDTKAAQDLTQIQEYEGTVDFGDLPFDPV